MRLRIRLKALRHSSAFSIRPSIVMTDPIIDSEFVTRWFSSASKRPASAISRSCSTRRNSVTSSIASRSVLAMSPWPRILRALTDHLVVFQRRPVRNDPGKTLDQLRVRPLVRAEVREVPPDRLLRPDPEGAVERAAGLDLDEPVVEHKERLAQRVDDSLREMPQPQEFARPVRRLGHVADGQQDQPRRRRSSGSCGR